MKHRIAFLAVSIFLLAAIVAIAAGTVESVGRGLYSLVGTVGRIVALVRSNYVEEVPVEKLETGAMTGLVEAADPGGVWVPDESASAYAAARERTVPPFGLVLGRRASYPYVLQVVPDSAADRAGIVPGELIERIGGEPVRARPLWSALVMLDGAERAGRKITADVIDRDAQAKHLVTMEPMAARMRNPSVDVNDGVAVVKVSSLDRKAASDLDASLRTRAGVEAVVADLRGVALGTPQGAVEVAVALAGGEVQLKLEGRDGKAESVRAQAPQRPWPVWVCIDGTTSQAGELAALALKVCGAKLVGLESYGDTGQRRSIAGAGGRLWIADRWGVAPGGKALLGAGLKPDEIVRVRRKGVDTILDRALELARGRRVQKAA